jgi:hypothetical protein
MKAIMAEAESSRQSPSKSSASTSLLSQQRPLQHSGSKEWRKTSWTPLTFGEQQRDGPSIPIRSTSITSGSPWKTTPGATITPNAPPATPPRPPLNVTPTGTPSSSTAPIRQSPGSVLGGGKPAGPSTPTTSTRQPSTSVNRSQSDPKMGPIITPSRRVQSNQAGPSTVRTTPYVSEIMLLRPSSNTKFFLGKLLVLGLYLPFSPQLAPQRLPQMHDPLLPRFNNLKRTKDRT